MDEQEEILQNNMISNLPLLFANGYPTSLDKISESQLERFIPFMVQCSLGHINLQGQVDCSEPEWWPEDLPFNIPFHKPKKYNGNWMQRLKEVVLICYQFHKSVFLLRFCNDLSSYEHASLRFINNYNSTTSLFDRRSNKLLVTFRNENMSYDQPQRLRKCLLQQKSKNENNGLNILQQMVEPAPFDIYLCDNCDAELYSKEAILEHEKTCLLEDDDVILCDTPEMCENHQIEENNLEDNKQRIGFLLNFNLQYKYKINMINDKNCDSACKTIPSDILQKESQFMIIDKEKRISRRNRAVHSVSRCPTIPLSSPAGQLLLRSTKTVITSEYLIERLDRIERFCHAPLVSKLTSRPKFLEKKNSASTPHCTFKRPQEYSTHLYIFPRRQFSQKRRMDNILLINSTLLRRCRPISVRIKKISDIHNKQCTSSSNKLNIKLTRDNSRGSNWKISSCPSTEIIVDTIDLCTSDEEDNQVNFCDAKLSYIAERASVESDITNSNINSINPLALHTSLSQIRKQLNFSRESQLFTNSLNNSHNGNENYNSTSCLMQIVPKNENNTKKNLIKNKNSINKSVVNNKNININFTKSLRPSVYILSNCSTTTPTINDKNLNTNFIESNNKFISAPINSTEDAMGNWLLSQHNVNIVSNIEDNLLEKHNLTSSKTLTEEDHGNRTLPLILHKSRVVSIDLTS